MYNIKEIKAIDNLQRIFVRFIKREKTKMGNSVSSGEKLKAENRIGMIDVAKGIGIILVVFAHINYTPNILNAIYSFHMPLFFLISGMMFSKQKYNSFLKFVKRKFTTLICPYIFFYILAIVYIYGFQTIINGLSSFNFQQFLFDFMQMFLSQGSSKVVSAPLWFVLCLFAVEMI